METEARARYQPTGIDTSVFKPGTPEYNKEWNRVRPDRRKLHAQRYYRRLKAAKAGKFRPDSKTLERRVWDLELQVRELRQLVNSQQQGNVLA